MLIRLSAITALLALAIACDPTTPTGTTPDPDTEVDTDAPHADTLPCPEYWGGEFPVLQVDAYVYNGQAVYLSRPDCCDMFGEVRLQDTCEYVCAADGGFTGMGDGRCPDFFDRAAFDETVWSAPE